MKVTLHLPESYSLKDKRRIVQSILTRIRQKFRVATSEVAEQSVWNRAVLGFACVTSSHVQAQAIMAAVVDWIAQSWDVDVTDSRIEIFE